jgi:hypothetical protein
MGSVDWEIRPATPWNYGLVLEIENPEKHISVRKNRIGKLPFSDTGELVFLPNAKQYHPWTEEAPVVLEIKGKKIPEWKIKNNSADDPPPGPLSSNQKIERLELVPYGCSRLRITEFPLIDL